MVPPYKRRLHQAWGGCTRRIGGSRRSQPTGKSRAKRMSSVRKTGNRILALCDRTDALAIFGQIRNRCLTSSFHLATFKFEIHENVSTFRPNFLFLGRVANHVFLLKQNRSLVICRLVRCVSLGHCSLVTQTEKKTLRLLLKACFCG